MKCVELAYIHPRALVLCRDFVDGKYVYSLHIKPCEEWAMHFGVSGRKIAEFSSSNEHEALSAAIDYIIARASEHGFSLKTILHDMIYKLLTR